MGKKDKKIIITTDNSGGKYCGNCPQEKKNCKCQNKK